MSSVRALISPAFKKQFVQKLLDYIDARMEDPTHAQHVTLSEIALTNAFVEANVDINFLYTRRGLTDGISEGKLAGVFLFRFSKHRFIHLSYPLTEMEQYRTLQEAAVINALFEIMQIDVGGEWFKGNIGQRRFPGSKRILPNVLNELLYLLTSRHSNQEAVALFFDTMCHLEWIARQSAVTKAAS